MAARTLEMPKREDVAVKVEAAIYRKAKMVAAYRDITIAEYLSDLLRKLVERDYRKMTTEMGESQEQEG